MPTRLGRRRCSKRSRSGASVPSTISSVRPSTSCPTHLAMSPASASPSTAAPSPRSDRSPGAFPMPDSVSLHRLAALDSPARAALLRRSESDMSQFLDKVRPIIEAVRTEGDAALARFARDFDRSEVDPTAIAATPAEFDQAFCALEPEVTEAIEFAVHNIRRFHEAQKPEEMWMKEIVPGAFAGDRFRPIPSVACYVPRGKGAFPSVVMMTTIPAVVAGVPDIAIVTPPGPGGKLDAATLVAARLAGVSKVYKCGGAQGVAAVAHGTE